MTSSAPQTERRGWSLDPHEGVEHGTGRSGSGAAAGSGGEEFGARPPETHASERVSCWDSDPRRLEVLIFSGVTYVLERDYWVASAAGGAACCDSSIRAFSSASGFPEAPM